MQNVNQIRFVTGDQNSAQKFSVSANAVNVHIFDSVKDELLQKEKRDVRLNIYLIVYSI